MLASITLLCYSNAIAQSVHAIVFCDTNDSKIGQAMMIDHDKAICELSNIACYIDYDIFINDFYGDNCNKQNLLSTISQLDVAPDDIVIFFYSGHGARALGNENDPFPQMCLGTNIESEWVPLQYAVNRIAAKKPKLLVAISNCCNMETPGVTIKPLLSQMTGATSLSEVNKNAMVNLFCQSEGQAIITSSQPGQYSWCDTYNGGLFTCDVFDVLLLVGQEKVSPDWESTFATMKEKTSTRQINTNEPPFKASQTPYYTIIRNNDTRTEKDQPNYDEDCIERDFDIHNTKDTDKGNTLYLALNSLVDENKSKDTRLQMIPNILQTYFANNAKVRTLGRNGMTVDYENAADFLRRIALSRRIAKITVLNENGNNKKTEISVHEIHK